MVAPPRRIFVMPREREPPPVVYVPPCTAQRTISGQSGDEFVLETGMGRRERLPHSRTGESACPTFVSLQFVCRKACQAAGSGHKRFDRLMSSLSLEAKGEVARARRAHQYNFRIRAVTCDLTRCRGASQFMSM